MSTIIRLRGINFNNPSLPVVSSFVRNGLVAAFRPAGDASSMVDLSGNGISLTKRGTPSFTEFGVMGNGVNGYRTNAPETSNLTLIAIARNHAISSWAAFAVGTYYNDTVGAERGASLWISQANGSNAGKYDVRAQSQSHYKKNDNSGYTNQILVNELLHDETDVATTPISNWAFSAVTIDAAANVMKAYSPRINNVGPTSTATPGSLATPGNFANRLLADPVTGTPNYFEICSTPDTTWVSAQAEVAEVLIYDRALTDAEIMEQYGLSKDFMKKVRNIVI